MIKAQILSLIIYYLLLKVWSLSFTFYILIVDSALERSYTYVSIFDIILFGKYLIITKLNFLPYLFLLSVFEADILFDL